MRGQDALAPAGETPALHPLVHFHVARPGSANVSLIVSVDKDPLTVRVGKLHPPN